MHIFNHIALTKRTKLKIFHISKSNSLFYVIKVDIKIIITHFYDYSSAEIKIDIIFIQLFFKSTIVQGKGWDTKLKLKIVYIHESFNTNI